MKNNKQNFENDELYSDLNRVLGVISDFHSKHDCVSDLAKVVRIANKYNIKLSLSFDIEEYDSYDFTREDYLELKKIRRLNDG